MKFMSMENATRFWANIKGKFVAQEEGKGLSTNDYSDAEKAKTLYKNQTPSTIAVGGIEKGYVPPETGAEAVAMIDKLLHPYVAPSVTAAMTPANGGVVEVGTTQNVTGVTVNVTLGSAAVTKIEAFDGDTSLGALTTGIKAGANTITFADPLAVTANKQLSAVVTDAEKKTVTAKTGAFTFVNAFYWGAIAADAEVNADTITAATKAVEAKGNKKWAYTCDNQKMLFAYPKSYGALSKIFDANNFDVTGTFAQSEVEVGGVAYYAYVNSASTVTKFNMTFNF